MTETPAAGIEREQFATGRRFAHHVHDRHQLAWASRGAIVVEVEDRRWMLPTTLALWIPAGVGHVARAVRASTVEGIHVDPAGCPSSPTVPTVMAISPLARQLVQHLATPLPGARRERAEAVLLDVVHPVASRPIELPMPADQRARQVARILLSDPADRRNLDELGRQVGASPRTLLRLFLAETSLPFNQWRTQARLHAALPYLADGHPVARVADRVGYGTASAFVAAFRRVTGSTPGTYFR